MSRKPKPVLGTRTRTGISVIVNVALRSVLTPWTLTSLKMHIKLAVDVNIERNNIVSNRPSRRHVKCKLIGFITEQRTRTEHKSIQGCTDFNKRTLTAIVTAVFDVQAGRRYGLLAADNRHIKSKPKLIGRL